MNQSIDSSLNALKYTATDGNYNHYDHKGVHFRMCAEAVDLFEAAAVCERACMDIQTAYGYNGGSGARELFVYRINGLRRKLSAIGVETTSPIEGLATEAGPAWISQCALEAEREARKIEQSLEKPN